MITPRELVQGVDMIEDPSVNNRVRLMLALDSDDQRIGIQIDQRHVMLLKHGKVLLILTRLQQIFLM